MLTKLVTKTYTKKHAIRKEPNPMGQLFILWSPLIRKKAGASNRSYSLKNLAIGLKKRNIFFLVLRRGNYSDLTFSLISAFDSFLFISLTFY